MGNQKQKWTQEEEDALLAGIAKHGPGKWKNIIRDPEFASILTHRSNIDLKDKWRNLSVSAGQCSKDKERVLKALSAPHSSTLNSPAAPANDESSDAVMDDAPESTVDAKSAPRYNAMIFEALSTMKDTKGSDLSAIVHFIEQRHEVPRNFRRLLSSRLRRLVLQGKIEKVQNFYKVRNGTSPVKRIPTTKQKNNRPRPSQNYGVASAEAVEEAALTAAYKVVEAENKYIIAYDAVKEAERVAKMTEDTVLLLELAKEIKEQCSRGEIVLLA
ncbi:putative Homeodomain-like/winged-helix DNA-binding family protein [Tripterygium wilfordii]|uniref:MYB transcription factor n=1 Tax=Tripterygium wilfordii TaxID=458696 RepID=A0A7J7DKT0_TRIWF|nr:telomere repeat-binding factor 4-like [Tripterygium wilfordii]XP_038703414.1 telomere repeat-binding factor 4-like [Tripterygium wilfordii]KAF5746879.1 putative Homeodomain-like/winged-helix DNA-binding family protein [Tripterygium wilfordii]